MQAQAVADGFGIALADAVQQREAFLDRYPAIKEAVVRVVEDGRIRGYAAVYGNKKNRTGASHDRGGFVLTSRDSAQGPAVPSALLESRGRFERRTASAEKSQKFF
jgi:hypothetical protein